MSNLDSTLQYLHWALIAAHAEADQECREVRIRVLLDSRSTITSYVLKKAPEEADVKSQLLSACDAVFTALTGPKKFNRQGCIDLLRKAMEKAREEGVRFPETRKEPVG